ncbi:MAG: hypothetical protein ACM3ZE_11070 [Myxococcales bacterium]
MHGLLEDVEFQERLWRVDVELAEQLRVRGCPRRHCGGRLQGANFQRKVRGVSVDGSQFGKRLGLCCGRCRRRVLPPTVRFFGRSSYAFIAVLVATVTALLGAVTARAILVGAAWRTVSRWLRFMQCGLAAHPQWQASRGRLPAELSLPRMPLAVIEVFGPSDSAQAWFAALHWLSPITTTPLFSSRITRAG